jgi:multidrug efflux pump subunit AcrB
MQIGNKPSGVWQAASGARCREIMMTAMALIAGVVAANDVGFAEAHSLLPDHS